MVLPLVGYTDRFSAKPGDTLSFMVSCSARTPYRASLVRLICGDPNPHGPGYQEVDLSSEFETELPSRQQATALGSYAFVNRADGPVRIGESITVMATIWPTTPKKGSQGIVSWQSKTAGFVLGVNDAGRLEFGLRAGKVHEVVDTGDDLRARRFYRVWASFDAAAGCLRVGQMDLETGVTAEQSLALDWDAPAIQELPPGEQTFLLAASGTDPVRHHFNGKLESPLIARGVLGAEQMARVRIDRDHVIAHWDFAEDVPSVVARDVGPHGLHATLVNLPTRAMMGASWSGREMCWRHAPEEYAAIHFHDDDFYDAAWSPDFRWTVPDLPSGIYAMRLTCGKLRDYLVFVIRPAMPHAAMALLLPTLTYQTYANYARLENPQLRERAAEWNVAQNIVAEHPEYGLSAYNKHSDGSGVCHASSRRPMLEFRPGQLHTFDPKGSGLLHLNADLHLVAWLEANKVAYDVITDHDLHREGTKLLSAYSCVMTGAHPEYQTRETLDGLEDYVKAGGRLIYLGANGFYWRICFHRDVPDVIELRRAEGGVRSWASEPGEYYHAFDGLYGGLWRRMNRPPQRLAAVGFSSQGDYTSSFYRRTPASYEHEAKWIMSGIDDEILGDFGYFGGGAAGLELDRADEALGTPENAVVLATSEGHSDAFKVANEEMETQNPPRPLPELIRADITYARNGSGEVFAVGSMNFVGSLQWKGGQNNISRMLLNVVRGFQSQEGRTK